MNKKFVLTAFVLVNMLLTLAVGVGSTLNAAAAPLGQDEAPTIQSDLPDYNPGQLVTLSGSGWTGDTTVSISVDDDQGQNWRYADSIAVQQDGTILDTFNLPTQFVAQYFVTATGKETGRVATTSFTDANPSADLDQCANDPAPSPSTDGCSASASDWVNGNLGASKAVYFEGDSIPYRLKLGSLSTSGSHTVTIEWDTTKSSTHALDYLTTFNRTVATANPCLGVSGCDPGTFTTFAIPADPQVTGGGVTPVAGNFTLYGGTITAVSAYSYANGGGFTGDKSARITITFTASVVNPVLAWGGHISSRADWGANNSAIAIPGSPYHTRLIDLDGSGGNQDRSLSAEAVIFPGSITIIKDATPNGAASFGFTASPAPLSNFSLVDDGTSANTKMFSNITNFQTYTVNESSIPSGWGFDSVSCSVTTPNGGAYTTSTTTVNINMKEGENWTCTYLDSLRVGMLTVIKHVVNDNGGAATADQWSIHVKSGANEVSGSPQAGSESGTTYTLTGGTYTVSETGGPSGYTFTGFSGDCDSSGNVTVVAGQTKACTLTNDDQTAHLKLVKVVVNDNGGTNMEADWTLSASGPTPLSGSGPTVESDVNAGTYDLSESGPSGYSTTGYDCGASVTLAPGESKTCTITNDDQTAHLKLVKVVVNDNGGTAAATDFTLSASGPTPISGAGGAESDINPGTYDLSETSVAGYTASDWSCVGGTQNGASVTLALGESATCTINNDDQPAHLKLIKTVTNDNGGTAAATDFTLSAAGPTPISGAGGAESDVNPGTYDLSETNVAGYTAADWSCVGGTQNGASVTLALGESATCTINNDDQPAHLKLIKTVTNDNGGTAAATDFTLSATGPTPISGAGGAESDVNAGTYDLSETNVAGYAAGDWSCVGGTQNGASVTLALGESATCTITNDDQPGTLIVKKLVINHNGGTKQATDFAFTVNNGSATTFLQDGSDPLKGMNTMTVDAGMYSVVEDGTPIPGYSTTYLAGDFTQSCSMLQVTNGGTTVCTITNDDIAPKLHLRKVVVNDNGGTKTVADFTLTADGTGTNDLSGTSPVDSGAGLQADTWALSESGPSDYTASDWSCVGGTQNGASVTLALGDEATCTITNDDQTAHLKLVKVVVNDNGGTAVATDFTLSATGPTPISGAGGAESDVNAGTYDLSETNVAGYTAGDWSCVGGTQNGANVTLALGESATCTITNDDQTAHLKLVKVVVNDNGGTAAATDFTLSAAGPTPISGAGGTESDVNAGTYHLSESGPSGYSTTGYDCGSSITLALGESKTCTITNDDIAPKLHLRKIVVNDNGGTATVTDFTLSADGTGANDLSGTSPVDSGAGLQADTWTLSESGPSGYAASDWSCVGGTQNGASVTLGIGDEATCTITNDDIAPKLHLRKVVVNDNGGTKTIADFTLTANGTGTNDLSGTSPVDSGAGLKADTWALSETSVYGYTASAWSCVGGTQNGSNITLGLGEEATCTITNDDQPGTIIVQKIIKPVGALTSFSFTTTGSGYTSFSLAGGEQNSQTINAGSYTVQELVPLGWVLTGIGGSSDPNTPYNCTVTGSGGSTGVGDLNTQTATIELQNGDTVTCVFENTGQGVTRTQGFWATHPQLANIAWFGGTAFGHTFPGVSDTMLCGRSIDTLEKLMGAFWSDISKTTNGKKRSSLDQARMQLLQQLIAAELNGSAFGSVPSSGSFAAWEAAYCGTNQNAIKTAQQQAASFNSAGDSGTFTPGTSADSKTARSIANKVFWDTLP